MPCRNTRDGVPPRILVRAQYVHQDGRDGGRRQTLGRLRPRDASRPTNAAAATHISTQRSAVPHRQIRQSQARTRNSWGPRAPHRHHIFVLDGGIAVGAGFVRDQRRTDVCARFVELLDGQQTRTGSA